MRPLNPLLYSPAQRLAAEGKLPADHPLWKLRGDALTGDVTRDPGLTYGTCSAKGCTVLHVTGRVPGEHPVYRWDTPGLPPRTFAERCANHKGQCAFRDDDPARCPHCHRLWTEVTRRALELPHTCVGEG